MNEEYAITIPLVPITKKNHQRIRKNMRTGGRYIAPSQAFENYQMACWPYLVGHKKKIDRPCNVRAIYYMPDNRKVDLANLHNALHDILVKYEVLADDNCRIIASTDGSRVRVDKEFPRTEITITMYDDDNTQHM